MSKKRNIGIVALVKFSSQCRAKGWDGKGKRSQKKGHLQFSDSFEGGNIGKVVVCKPKQEYTIWLRADTANDKFRLWFNFTVRLCLQNHRCCLPCCYIFDTALTVLLYAMQITNAVKGQMVLITIVNFSKTRSLYRAGMTPVFRSSKVFPQWSRLPPESCYYYMCVAGSMDVLLYACKCDHVYMLLAFPFSDGITLASELQAGTTRFGLCPFHGPAVPWWPKRGVHRISMHAHPACIDVVQQPCVEKAVTPVCLTTSASISASF